MRDAKSRVRWFKTVAPLHLVWCRARSERSNVIQPARATRKFAVTLVEATPHNTKFGVVSCGNHEVRDLPNFEVYVRSDDGQRDVLVHGNRAFAYHGTVIAVAEDTGKYLTVTCAGWGSMSTNAALNQYISHFKWLGYKIVVAN